MRALERLHDNKEFNLAGESTVNTNKKAKKYQSANEKLLRVLQDYSDYSSFSEYLDAIAKCFV